MVDNKCCKAIFDKIGIVKIPIKIHRIELNTIAKYINWSFFNGLKSIIIPEFGMKQKSNIKYIKVSPS